jgi:hypothetical protein
LSNGFAVDAVQNRMDRTVEAVPSRPAFDLDHDGLLPFIIIIKIIII